MKIAGGLANWAPGAAMAGRSVGGTYVARAMRQIPNQAPVNCGEDVETGIGELPRWAKVLRSYLCPIAFLQRWW